MNTRDRTSLTALRRCHDFIAIHAAELGVVIQTPAWTMLYNAIAHIDRRLEHHYLAAKLRFAASDDVHALRHRLSIGAIRPVVTLARTMLSAHRELGVLTIPRPGAAVAELIHTGHETADVVDRYWREFACVGLNAHAAENLRTLATRLDDAFTRRQTIDRQQFQRTVEIAQYLRRARTATQLLDVIIGSEHHNAPEVIAAWKRARAVSITLA